MLRVGSILFFLFLAAGCAQKAVLTNPDLGITYTDKGVEADVHGDLSRVRERSTGVLTRLGYVSDGDQWKSGIATIELKISKNGSNSSHVEVIAVTGTQCWPQDFAAQVLQDIAESTKQS